MKQLYKEYFICFHEIRHEYCKLTKSRGPPWGPRGLSRECVLRIPMRVIKGDYNGAVSRNNRKKEDPVSIDAWTGTFKEPYEMSMAWEPDRRFNLFLRPPSHLCAVTYMTEISLNVTLSNHIHSLIHSPKAAEVSLIKMSINCLRLRSTMNSPISGMKTNWSSSCAYQ